MTSPRIGVLSLQGDFACHAGALMAIGATPVRVTLPRDLDDVEALVMPGGESTTMTRLLESTGLRAPIERFVRERPVLGTCAGLILLGRGGERLPAPSFAALDVDVARNAYGRQIDSFSDTLRVPPLGGSFHGVFIRAPRILRVGEGVEVVAWRGDEAVGVRQGRIVGICFHPELTSDRRFHRWFVTDVAGLRLPEAEPARPETPARRDRRA